MTDLEQFLTKHLSCCQLCPRRCKVNRMDGVSGFCGATAQIKAGRAGLHFWEEPCLSGKSGSGTVFFSHCTLRCVFCQNHQISNQNQGIVISVSRLSEIFLELQQQGAVNINLVTPTHYLPQILLALKQAKEQGLSVPIVYNSSGYERVETVMLLKDWVDIYLPDMKYYDPNLSEKYSYTKDYFEQTHLAIAQMILQAGAPTFDQNGIMQSGVILRHLMLPGHLEDSKRIIRFIGEHFKDQVYLSLMNQYTPLPQAAAFPQLNQKLDPLDYDDAISYAISLGIHQGFIQEEETASESFIPDFDGTGL